MNAANRFALIVVTIIAFLGVSLAAAGYHVAYKTTSKTLTELRDQVEKKNQEAEQKLAELTAQRDMKQAALDKAAADQERKDNASQAEIDRLTDELHKRPVRVRIVPTATSRGCSGSAAGDAAGATEPGAADPGAAYGVLPAENTRRLAIALKEVETLSAAYNSCRATLMPPQVK